MPITLHEAHATCPKCKGQEWLIIMDGFNLIFENILSFKCAACDLEVLLQTKKQQDFLKEWGVDA